MSLINIQSLYAEAVEVSNAADAFETEREFDETTKFVGEISEVQESFVQHMVGLAEKLVIEAAASGAKHAVIYTFRGADVFEGFNVLFMLLGGPDYEQRTRLENFGFVPMFDRLHAVFAPFLLRRTWERSTNENSLILHWE